MLLLASVVGNQWKVDPAEAGDEALRAAALLAEAGEAGAAVFAETAGAVMLLRAGALDQASRIAVRTLAAIEDLPANEEWGSRTANALGVIFGELHAFELAAQSTARALSWPEAANDPTARVMIESVRGYYAVRGAETHPEGSGGRQRCVALAEEAAEGLDGIPAGVVSRSCIQTELSLLTGRTPDLADLETTREFYDDAPGAWVGWHQLLHGRTLNDVARPGDAIPFLRRALENPFAFGEQIARRELARSLAAVGDHEEALEELQRVVDHFDDFVRRHVARQATDLAERVEAEQRAAALRKRSDQLAEQVARDHLTGVASRRALDSFLDRSVDAVAEQAVLVCDLDHFKLVNDSFGHAVGDQVLTLVGQLLIEHTRTKDFVGRYGGEEFVLVIDGNAATAVDAAERVRSAIETAPWSDVASDLQLTVSIGVAAGDLPLRDLLRAADMAVYEAKDNGRNRVQVADSGIATGAAASSSSPSRVAKA